MNIQLLYKDAKAPTYGTEYSAGMDLYACQVPEGGIVISPNCSTFINTGIACEIPQNNVGLVYARSGLACKSGLRPANCVGVIDADYRGEIKVCLHNDSNTPYTVKPGERVAQLVIQPYIKECIQVVDDLSKTTRGDGGFGSTGKA